MITNITELLNNFRNDFPCVIELNYDGPSPSISLLYAPINNIIDAGEIQDENTDVIYDVHEIHIICGATNVIVIKAYWTSNIYYDDSIGKWKIFEPK